MSTYIPDLTDPDFISKNAPPKARRASAPEFKMVEDSDPEFKMVEAPGGSKEQLAVDMARATTSGFPRAPLPKANSGLSLGTPPRTVTSLEAPGLALASEQRERRAAQIPVGPVSADEGATPKQAAAQRPQPFAPSGTSRPYVSPEEPAAVPLPTEARFANPGKASPQEAQADIEGPFGAKALTGYRGYGKMAENLSTLVPTSTQPYPSRKQAIQAATGTLKGAGEAATPLMVMGAIAQPEVAAFAFAGGTAGGYGGRKIAELVKASPETQDLADQVGQLIGGAAGVGAYAGVRNAVNPLDALADLLWKRGYIQDANGKPLHITSQGDARAVAAEIIRQNPQGLLGSAVTKYRAGQAAENVAPRQNMGVAQPAGMPLGLPQAGGASAPGQNALPKSPQPDASAQLITEYDKAQAKAQRVVTGQEPLIPPPPPAPLAPPLITAQDVQRETQRIAKLPPDQQGAAMQDAHAKLAQTLFAQGQHGKPVPLPNGQLADIPDEKAASKVALGLINDAVKDHDKAQEVAAKEAEKSAKEAEKEAAKPAPTNGNRQTRGQKAAELAEPVVKMVEAPAEPEFKMVEGNGNGQNADLRHQENANAGVSVPLESDGPTGRTVSGTGEGQHEQLPGGVSEGRSPSSDEPQRLAKADAVTFPSKVQLEGRIVQPGETGTVQWADANSARVKLDSDGKVINSVALRHIEKKEAPTERRRSPRIVENPPAATDEARSPEDLATRAFLSSDGAKDIGAEARKATEAKLGPIPRNGKEKAAEVESTRLEDLVGAPAEKKPVTPQVESGTKYVLPGFVTNGLTKGAENGDLTAHLLDKISVGEMPKDNLALRRIVEKFDGKLSHPARIKQAQEALEVAIVQHARAIVSKGGDTEETFNKLVDLYNSQPNLNVRTSTSIENQAYSTPAPLAFLADKLAGVGKSTSLYEPTAGNGMLTIAADPKKVRVNELNPERADALRKQGFPEVTDYDAAEAWGPQHKATLGKAYDAVVANPPFGSVKDAQGNPIKERVDGYKIGQIDHLIAARALDAMKDDGKAVLILGANKFTAGAQSTDDNIFLNWLYSHYTVAGHFELDGKLYGRQGAAWPVRVITIDGRLASDKIAPAPDSIQRVSNWKEAYGQYSAIVASRDSEPPRERGAGDSLQRQAANEPRVVRTTSGAAPEKVDRQEPPASPVRTDEQRGEATGPVRNSHPERHGGVAISDSSVRPDADVARSDRLEKGHKPELERPAVPRGADSSTLAISPQGNEYQVPYTPASSKKDVSVLIPTNMKQPLEDAMAALEDQVGDIDKFVAKELGYDSIQDLHDAFMGLQTDSIAGAIQQIKNGKAVVIADQTGIGKGRQAAAIIRWAAKNGNIPVFITKAPSLFTDMYGDLADIGTDDINPFIVNADEWIRRPDGSKAFANKPGQGKVLEKIIMSGELPDDRNAVFLTYSQINQANRQQQALRRLAPKAVFVLDESHNAGGDSNTGDFLRAALQDAKGVTYLSATYAKRPDNMPLYFKTDMGEAIGDSGTLIQAMKDGGLPLQTVVSHNLVKAGQMFRRERSYDGVSMKTKVDTDNKAEHTKIANSATEALRAITDADKAFHTTYVKEAQKQALKENKSNKIAGGGNEASKTVHHTEFSSVVHNFVRQMLLGIKANTAADDAIAAIKRGEKPIIAVDNTMGSFLSAYAGDKGIRDGEPLEDFDYRTVLARALDRSRYLAVTNAMGDTTKRYVPLDELDPETRKAYDDAQQTIDKLKIDLPVSPIDWIRQRIEDAGHTVAEITGRNLSVDYSDEGNPKLSHVPTQEQTDKVETTRRFNDGRLDALIANVAGSTGISLHASEKFADQKPRHMIVAQPAQDINVFMQMLGRIHRTGQVRLPSYTILNADLPAEKRPSALLSKKMKSLNANTSSNTESATSVKAADMLNKYGDQIIGTYLADNPALADMLHVTPVNEDGSPTEDIARKATGKLAILPVKVQEEFYRDVEQQYHDYIAYLDSTNQNELEPKTFDYDARETKSTELIAATNPNTPFGDSAIYNEYSIKSQGKPLTPDEATDSIKEHLDGKTGDAHIGDLIGKLDGELMYYKQSLDPESPMVGQSEIVARTGRDFLRDHKIGSTWRVEINGDIYNAAVTNIRSTHKTTGNPYALSKINVTLATNGSLRSLSVPATQMQRIEVTKLYDKPADIFRGTAKETRETAKIITGNLLAAYGELQATRGTIINFSKADGTTEQGILLPKRFELAENTRGDYRLQNPEHAVKFLRKSINPRIEDIGIASRDNNVRVVNNAGKLEIVTPKSKARGGKYFLDHGITDLTGDFVSSQNTMRAPIPKGKESAVIEQLMKKTALYASPSMAEEAKSFGSKVAKEAKPVSAPNSKLQAGEEKGTHEPSLYFPENPKSLRHTTGPLSAGDALGIEFTERDPGNGVPNYLRLNSSALNIVRRAEGHQFNGISMAKSAVREVTNKLDDYAEELFIRGYPAAAEKVRTVANAMWRSFRKEDGLTIVAAHSDPAEEIKVIHEELYHAAVQRRAGGGRLARGVPYEEMISDPGIAKMRPRIEAEVPGAHSLIVLTEAAADLAVGTYDELTPAEAETSSEHYYTALADANGVKPLEAAQAIFDHIDSLAAEAGIIKPGEQFNAEGNGPNRAALTRILGSRRGTPDSGSSLRARPDVEEPPSIEQRNISAAGNNSVAKNGEDGTVAPANVRPDAGTSTLAGPDLGRHSVRLGESDAGREASRRSEEVQAGQNGGEPESRPARSGSAAGNLSREGAGSGRVAKNTPAALHSTAPVGLTDDELADWSKSRGFRYEPAGEQLGIFGGGDQVVRVFRTGAKGKEERGLAYQTQIDALSYQKTEEPTEPFSLTGGEAPKEEQPRLFGAGDLGEIIGTPQGKAKPPAKDDYSLFSGQRGIARTGAINPIEVVKNAKKVYDDLISKVIDQKLDLGDKYRRVAQHDPVIAKMLHEKDHAPRYFSEKADSNVHQVVKGLSEDQIRSAAMMVDSDAREYLEAKYPEQYLHALNDPAVMAAVKKFKQYQDELAALRISLGWHVRRDLSAIETEDGTWEVVDQDGQSVETFKKYAEAKEFIEDNGRILDHLKRVYPEHLREPLMGKTNEGPGLGGSYGGIKAPRPDKKQRLATAEYFYQHGAKDFTGYIKSYTQAYHAALNQKIFDSLTGEATQWKDGTSAPSSIEYRGKTYYRPEIAKSMKEGNPFKVVPEYKAYDPAKGDKMLIKSFEDGWATQTTGRPGISPTDRYLAPKEIVEALDNYDMTRGVKENDSIRRFFQDQIVGLFGPTVHVFNIMRRLAHVAGTGVWDPRVWPYLQKLFASQELRDRMAEGLADDTIDFLSKHGSYTNARDIGSLHDYFLWNMDPKLNPLNWPRMTIGKFSKGILFDPKFMGGRGGLDQKARVLAADIYRGKGMSEEEASKRVEEDFGKYNKANWTERMKRWARAFLFPGWDFSSIMHFLRMPLKTALYPALATVLANLGLNLLGKNKDQDKYDYSYIHYGDRKYRSGLITESMAAHIAEPLLAAGRAALEGGNADDVTSAAISGGVRGLAGVAGNLRPDMMMAASVVFNREYPGGSKEIWKPEDSFLPGKVTPTRKLDKILAFTLVKTFPAVNRFMDSSYDNVDMMTGAGSVLGVSNYKAGAEERLRANAARSKGYSQELSDLNATNPEAAEKLEQDPDKAIYLLFNKDFSELEKELSDIDKEARDTRMADGISSADRKEHLADLEEDRKQHLASADAIADEIASERAEMRKEARK